MTLDSKSLSTAASPPLRGVVFRAWSGTRWVETAVSGLDERALVGAAESLESQLAASRSGSPPPGPSATTVGSFDTAPSRPMRDLGTEGALAWVREVFRWLTDVPTIKFARVSLNWADEERYYLNTAGANCFQRLNRVHAGVVPVAIENGRSEFDATASAASEVRRPSMPSPRPRRVGFRGGSFAPERESSPERPDERPARPRNHGDLRPRVVRPRDRGRPVRSGPIVPPAAPRPDRLGRSS